MDLSQELVVRKSLCRAARGYGRMAKNRIQNSSWQLEKVLGTHGVSLLSISLSDYEYAHPFSLF